MPVVNHVQTHEIPISRHITKGISWSDISYTPVKYFCMTN